MSIGLKLHVHQKIKGQQMININYERLKSIIQDELEKWKTEQVGTSESQPVKQPNKEQVKQYCKTAGFMNTSDWLKTIDALNRAESGKLYKKQ